MKGGRPEMSVVRMTGVLIRYLFPPNRNPNLNPNPFEAGLGLGLGLGLRLGGNRLESDSFENGVEVRRNRHRLTHGPEGGGGSLQAVAGEGADGEALALGDFGEVAGVPELLDAAHRRGG